MFRRSIFIIVLLCLFPAPAVVSAASFVTEDDIDDNLAYEGFDISQDRIISGYIVNTSGRRLAPFKLDMWTTDVHETRIFWRKSFDVPEMPPDGKFKIREPYAVDVDITLRTKYNFRVKDTRPPKAEAPKPPPPTRPDKSLKKPPAKPGRS